MIKEQTVFILGAGASFDFGYPLGEALKSQIIERLDPGISPYSHELKFLRGFGHDDQVIEDFRVRFWQSGQPSIDAFLENLKERKEFQVIGKRLIAVSLIQNEYNNKLFLHDDNWYRRFYKYLLKNRDEYSLSNLYIITFNYDRRLEHYLFTSLMYSFDFSEEQTADKMKMLNIIHIHGRLSPLEWQSSFGRPYSPELTPEIIDSASNDIKIIHEAEDDNEAVQKAKSIISHADRIHFLGFGYHDNNMERLGFPWKGERNHCHGMCYHMTNREKSDVRTKYNVNFNGIGDEWDTLNYVRNMISFV